VNLFTLDTVAPAASIVINSITSDNVVNTAEGASATVAITGTVGGEVAVGDTVTVTVNSVAATGLVTQSGSDKVFSINVTCANLLADTDVTVDASVTTTDAAGNSTTATATKVYSLDTTAPTIATVVADWVGAGKVVATAAAERVQVTREEATVVATAAAERVEVAREEATAAATEAAARVGAAAAAMVAALPRTTCASSRRAALACSAGRRRAARHPAAPG
jgi:hypothetical protein